MDCETQPAELEVKSFHSGRLMINRVCNERCVFCSTPPVGGELSFEEVKRRMIRLKEEGADELVITGGEPTLKKDFFEILELGQHLGFSEITVQSNGTMFFREEFVQRLAKLRRIMKVSVSFHSSDEKTFGELTKAPYVYKNVLKGLEMLGKYGISTIIVTVIQKANYPRLKDHLKFICERYPFIKHFSFNFIDPVYWAKDNSWTVPTFAEASPFIREALQYLEDYGKTFRIEKIPLCFIEGFEYAQSDLRRDVFNEKLMNIFFKRPTDSYGNEWHVHSTLHNFYAPQCAQCVLRQICPGINKQYVDIHGYEDIQPVTNKNPVEIMHKARQIELESNPHRLLTQEASQVLVSARLRRDPFRLEIFDEMKLFDEALQLLVGYNPFDDVYARLLQPSPRKERLAFILHCFRRNRLVSRGEYRKTFSQDVVTDFPHAVRALELLGILDINGENISFGEKDEYFYYPYFLFFVGRKNVEHALRTANASLGNQLQP
jgi:MoaA/NifB/PqqE/SkfB family radical SAM enzyme